MTYLTTHLEEIEQCHCQAFDTFNVGRLSLDAYLVRVVFHCRRPFTRAAFLTCMYAQSTPLLHMISLVFRLQAKHALSAVVVSNEGRELNAHHIHRFKLAGIVDFFISSSSHRSTALALEKVGLDLGTARKNKQPQS